MELFLEYGVLGVIAFILLGFSSMLLKREQKRADEIEEKWLSTNKTLNEKSIPMLGLVPQVLAEARIVTIKAREELIRDGYTPVSPPRLLRYPDESPGGPNVSEGHNETP